MAFIVLSKKQNGLPELTILHGYYYFFKNEPGPIWVPYVVPVSGWRQYLGFWRIVYGLINKKQVPICYQTKVLSAYVATKIYSFKKHGWVCYNESYYKFQQEIFYVKG